MKVTDVGAELFREIHLVFALLDVRAVDALDELAIENSGHRLDFRERLFQSFDEIFFENLRVLRSFVSVLGKNIPATENDVVERSERNELVHFLVAILGALAQADLTHLSVRADRLRDSALHSFNARVESRRDRAHSGGQNSELSFGGSNVERFIGCHESNSFVAYAA